MKKIVLFLITTFYASILFAQDKIVGTWITERDESKVEIFKKDNQYFGKIIWLAKDSKKGKISIDKNNPNKALRNRPIVGIDILQQIEYNNKNEWSGEIYSPKRGLTTDITIRQRKENTLDLTVSYMGFTKRIKWTKVS